MQLAREITEIYHNCKLYPMLLLTLLNALSTIQLLVVKAAFGDWSYWVENYFN